MTAKSPDLTRDLPDVPPLAEDLTPAPRRKVQWWQVVVLIGVLALLGLVAFQMGRTGPLAAGQVGTGERAPDFSLQTFDGGTLTLASLRGQVVVVNFWASWCKPCEAEAADLENTYRRYQDQGVMFVGIAYVDTATESLAYLDRFGITYPNAPDLGTDISHRYRIRGVPETFVIDQGGTLRALFVGPTTEAALTAAIDPLLAEAAD
jgi:cytochrome c biogenesis protein CcmG/thiol:disulfide interchange protein DsbE